MPLRNACFISYRHGQHDLMREFICDFASALEAEIEPMLRSGLVYLDRERLQGGHLFNESLARNLYESATLVMVYTPSYFSREDTWCAREFLAMEGLERERLQALGPVRRDSNGLIIPVVLRGESRLPDRIRCERQCYDFKDFQLGQRRLSRHPRFAPLIRQMASYICDRFEEIQTLPDQFFSQADRFSLPGENEILAHAEASAFRAPFPGMSALCQRPALWAQS